MNKLLSQILLAMLMVPLAVVFYVCVLLACESNLGDTEGFMLASLCTGGFVIFYWFGLWKKSVVWSRERINATIAVSVASLIFGFLAAAVMAGMMFGSELDLILFLGPVLTGLLWLVGTILVWCETPAERAERTKATESGAVFCPICEYNMTGLHECRCPECGTLFTIDQLMAAQRAESATDASGRTLDDGSEPLAPASSEISSKVNENDRTERS